MDSETCIKGRYLWGKKGIVPFPEIDEGFTNKENGIQLMESYPSLDELLECGVAKGIFDTKMRPFIAEANEEGVKANITQQFEFGKQILPHGLVPILEPEVDTNAADKTEAEDIALRELLTGLDDLADDQKIMIRVSIPTRDDPYKPLIEHPRVICVIALSGGYEHEDANERLSCSRSIIASFSRALSEGLSAQQPDERFNATMTESVKSIYEASIS